MISRRTNLEKWAEEMRWKMALHRRRVRSEAVRKVRRELYWSSSRPTANYAPADYPSNRSTTGSSMMAWREVAW